MGELLEFFFSIEAMIAALVVSGAWLLLRPKSTAARLFPLILGLLYLTASIYAVPAAIARLLTRGYHPFVASDVGPGRTAIVVLGSGSQTIAGWNGERTAVLGGDSAARVLEAARIARELPNALVISSGGASTSDDDETPVALVMRDQLIALGVARVADSRRDRFARHTRRGGRAGSDHAGARNPAGRPRDLGRPHAAFNWHLCRSGMERHPRDRAKSQLWKAAAPAIGTERHGPRVFERRCPRSVRHSLLLGSGMVPLTCCGMWCS